MQAPKKDKQEEDEEDKAFKEKQKADAAALKAAKEKGELSDFVVRMYMTHRTVRVQPPKVHFPSILQRIIVLNVFTGGAPGGGIKK